ncbi:VacJ family lipoprotein [Gammaproteobacteria bacterium]|nr:VacJ family lipoprotein [Gammaproteobacteria bacterium]
MERKHFILNAKSILLILLLVTTGCATTSSMSADFNPDDPYEKSNRKVFEFNNKIDKLFLRPVTDFYDKATPEFAQTSITNFFANLDDIRISINNLLQGNVVESMSDITRFFINSIFGLGGFFDVASEMGLEKHSEDFGQTLGKWGAKPGPYLMLPFLGPSTTRDAFTFVGDTALAPALSLDDNAARVGLISLDLINTYSAFTGIADIESKDQYAFLRDAYLERRKYEINDGLSEEDLSNDEDFEDF